MLLNETTKLLLTGSKALSTLQTADMSEAESTIGYVLSEVFPDLKFADMMCVVKKTFDEALNNAIVCAANKVNSYKKKEL